MATQRDGGTQSLVSTDRAEILKDEMEVLETYRRAKNLKYADINISVQEGHRVKLWLTEKMK